MGRTKRIICLIVVLFAILGMIIGQFYWSFNVRNIDSGLLGADIKEMKVSELDYSITEKKTIILSRACWIEYEGGYQIRLRVGYQIPFLHENLMFDTEWELTDSEDQFSEEVPIVVYPESIMGVHCINVTIFLTTEMVEALQGKVISFKGNCTVSGEESSYGRFVMDIMVPK